MIEIPTVLFYVIVAVFALVSICVILILFYLVLIVRMAKRFLDFIEMEGYALRKNMRNIGNFIKIFPLLFKKFF